MNLLDSSALIEVLRENSKGKKIIKYFGSNLAVTSVFSVHELLRNATLKELPILSKLLSEIEVFSYDKECALISSKLDRELKKKGKEIGAIDLCIASIALKNKLTIITLDKHFQRISGLKAKIF